MDQCVLTDLHQLRYGKMVCGGGCCPFARYIYTSIACYVTWYVALPEVHATYIKEQHLLYVYVLLQSHLYIFQPKVYTYKSAYTGSIQTHTYTCPGLLVYIIDSSLLKNMTSTQFSTGYWVVRVL